MGPYHSGADAGLARERIAAAVEAAAGELVITARSENFLHERPDLGDTIARLQSFQEAGADGLYAPWLRSLDDIRSVVDWISVQSWPVFNIADSAIFCSAVLMVWLSFRGIGLDGSRPGTTATTG